MTDFQNGGPRSLQMTTGVPDEPPTPIEPPPSMPDDDDDMPPPTPPTEPDPVPIQDPPPEPGGNAPQIV